MTSIPCRTQVWKPSAQAERLWVQHYVPKWERYRVEQGIDRLSDTELLMMTANSLPFGHPILHEFMILCWQQWWGDYMELERRGIVNHWLVKMLRALCSESIVQFLGCGSSGKTWVTAGYCYSMWKLKPHQTACFLSTTSAEAGESRTWGAVKDLHKMDTSSVGKRIESLHLITLDEEARDDDGTKQRDYRNVIKCVNIKPGQEGKNVMAAIVGRKNHRIIWQCDEMPFMDVGVLNARVNLNNNPFNQFIGLGNAPEEGDPLYIDAEPKDERFPDGWRSVDKDVEEDWPSRAGRCFYFNGAKSPNYKAPKDQPPPFSRLMHEEFRLKLLKDSGGEDTPMYWKQFYGFPPGVDIPDKVLTHKLLETHGCFEDPIWADNTQKVLGGLDLGFKEGGDPCVIHFGKVGVDTRSRTILASEPDGVVLTPSQKVNRDYEAQIAVRVVEECRKRNCHDIALDVTGDGGLLLQAIEREARAQKYELNVLAVSFSGTAEDRIVVPGEKRTGAQMFKNMVAQLWVSTRISATNGVLRGLGEHSNAKTQLCSRKGSNDDRKRFSVEPKKEMKKRLRRSPDHGDAYCLLHHLALRHGLSGMAIPAPPPKSPQEALQASGAAPRRYSGHGAASRYTGR